MCGNKNISAPCETKEKKQDFADEELNGAAVHPKGNTQRRQKKTKRKRMNQKQTEQKMARKRT